MSRPTGSNADEWALFIEEHANAVPFLAVQIAAAVEDAWKAGAMAGVKAYVAARDGTSKEKN